MASRQYQGTIVPVDDDKFNPEWAAEVFYKAMRGAGTDELAIIDMLVMHSNAQLQAIKIQYKTSYGQDPEEDLKSDLSGDFRTAVLDRLCPLSRLNARRLRKAMKGVGTDEETLIDILCSSTNAQIAEMKAAYLKEFERTLEDDIGKECGGNFKRILVSQVQANREETNEVNEYEAQEDAQALFDAGEGKWGTDEGVFNKILASRGFRHLRHVFEQYKSLSEKTIIEAIESETSGDVEKAYISLVKFAQNPIMFYAEQFHAAMSGLGTDEKELTRLVLTHCEADLVQIQQVFQTMYEKSLLEWVDEDTSGDYGLLVARLIDRKYSRAS